MPKLELDTGVSINFRDGAGEKPVLFVHGVAASLEAWNYQVQALKDRFRCVCFDLRGHGDSDKPYHGYDFDDHCADLQSLIDKLDLDDITLVGWSMGAGICLKYVSDFDDKSRVSKLVMVAPATPSFLATETEPFGSDRETAMATLEAMRTAYPETMAAFAGANFHRTDMQTTADWFLSEWLKTPVYAACQCFEALVAGDLRDKLAGIRLPVLVCHGRHDVIAEPRWSEYMASQIPDCRLEWFENSSHALMVEEPDRLSELLADFVG